MNALELLASAAKKEQGKFLVSLDDAKTAAQKSAMRYDREGDAHFDIASALMKSLRGSDPDAALHYLARLLEAGDMTTAIRRLLCSASEDVGMAYPQAALIVKACVDNALQLGLPEARLPSGPRRRCCWLLLPSLTRSIRALPPPWPDVKAGRVGDIPRELQNVHADSAGLEREQGYLYPHDFPGHWVAPAVPAGRAEKPEILPVRRQQDGTGRPPLLGRDQKALERKDLSWSRYGS